ncbi:MAG: CHASE3 domain-containing protein, partial [Thermoleophilia bacterium]|nr:CHASE3 domain-containing protein [Thermoleophilia bacterium]
MSRPVFDRWTLGAAGLIIFLIAVVAFNLRNASQLSRDAEWVAHTHQVMASLDEVGRHVREAQAAARADLTVGGDPIPAALAGHLNLAARKFDGVMDLTRDNHVQQARGVDVREDLARLREAWLGAALSRHLFGLDLEEAAEVSVRAGRLADRVGSNLRAMREAEQALLAGREVQRERTYRGTLLGGVVSGVASV